MPDRRTNSAKKIALPQALAEIQGHIDASQMPTSPFFLMVGAGVSAPVIPTAASIIKDCKHKLGDSCLAPPGLEHDYSWHVENALPSREERWRYFFDLINRKPLSRANRLLALALSKAALGNLLLTTNFDDQIEHALHILGENPAVVDSPDEVARFSGGDLGNPQVLYLHGKFVFQDLANVDEEIARRSDQAVRGGGAPSLYSYVTGLMRDRSPLIFGYGGSIEDVFMKALRDREKSGYLPPIYWFCYSTETVERLLPFILEDGTIRLVLAENGTLSAFQALGGLVKARWPHVASVNTPWSVPTLSENPTPAECKRFTSAAGKVRFNELETSELLDFGQRLTSCCKTELDDDRASLALEVAECLIGRDAPSAQHQGLLALALLANGKVRFDRKLFEASLPFLERARTQFATDETFTEVVTAADLLRIRALGALGRLKESQAFAREVLAECEARREPGILGNTMVIASYLAGTLLMKDKGEEAVGEARRWISWVESVYPGPISPGCIVGYYRSQYALARVHEESNESALQMSLLCRVVAGWRHLCGTEVEGCVALALFDRVRAWIDMDRYRKADRELRRIGRLFNSETEYQAREDFGRYEVKHAMMRFAMGLVSMQECDKLLEIARICADGPTVELERQLAHLRRMRASMTFCLGMFQECVDAADAYINRFGSIPKETLGYSAVNVMWLKFAALCALIGNGMEADRQEDVRHYAEELQHSVTPLRRTSTDARFCLTYAFYLRGNRELAAREAGEYTKIIDSQEHLSMRDNFLRPPKNDLNWDKPRLLQPAQQEFWDWLEAVTQSEKSAPPETKTDKLKHVLYEQFGSSMEPEPLKARWLDSKLNCLSRSTDRGTTAEA